MKKFSLPKGAIARRIKILLIVAVSVIASFVLSQFLLYYYANALLNDVITHVIKVQSDGLYKLRFDNLRIDMSARSFHLKNLQLVPNRELYWERKANNDVNTALYRIGIPSLDIEGIDSYRLFWKRELHVQDISFSKPIIKLVAGPNQQRDTTASGYDAIQQDLHLALSRMFSSVEINRIAVKDGYFDLQRGQHNEDAQTRFSNLSITLFRFFLNQGNQNSRNRLFYSDDIRIEVANYKLNLGDSIHSVQGEDILISTKNERISAKNIRLRPEQVPEDSLPGLNKNLLDISVPTLQLTGIDLPEAFFRKKIAVDSARLGHPYIKVYKQKTISRQRRDSLMLQRSARINLYGLIKGTLHEIKLDTLAFNHAYVSLFQRYGNKKPEILGSGLTVGLGDFKVDSAAFNQHDKIFYASNISLGLQDYTMFLADSLHRLKAENIRISSSEEHIFAENVRLNPIAPNKNNQSLYNIRVPALRLYGIDLPQAYNKRQFFISRLHIAAPYAKIKRYVQEYSSEDTVKRFTSDELYQLTSNYLKNLYIHRIYLSNGRVNINNQMQGGAFLSTSGNLSFQLGGFMLSPHTIFRREKPFNADDIRFTLTDYNSVLPQSNYRLQADSLRISSPDSTIDVHLFSMLPDSSASDSSQDMYMKLKARHLQIKDADIPAIYFNNKFRAGFVSLKQPDIRLKIRNPAPANDSTDNQRNVAYKHLRDTAALQLSNAQKGSFPLIYTTLYAPGDTLIAADSLLYEANLQLQDTLKVDFALSNLPDTFMLRGNRLLPRPEGFYTERGYDELVTSALTLGMADFPVHSFSLDSLRLQNGYLSVDDSLKKGPVKLSLHTGIDMHMRGFFLKPSEVRHNRDNPLFSEDYRLTLSNIGLHMPLKPFKTSLDSLHLIEARREVRLKGLRLANWQEGTNKYQLHFPEIRLQGINMEGLYRHGKAHLDSLLLQRPEVVYVRGGQLTENKKPAGPDSLKLQLPSQLQDIQVGHLSWQNSNTRIYSKDTSTANLQLQTGLTTVIDSMYLDRQVLASPDSLLTNQQGFIRMNKLHYQLPDKIHELTLDSLFMTLGGNSLNAWNARLDHPQNMRYARKLTMLERSGAHMLLQAHIPRLRYNKFNMQRLLEQRQFQMEQLHVDSPDVHVQRFPFLKKEASQAAGFKPEIPIQPFLQAAYLDTLRIPGADVKLSSFKGDSTTQIQLTDISTRVHGLSIDSASRQDKFLYSDDIRLVLKDQTYPLGESFYTGGFDALRLSTKEKRITIDHPVIYPPKSRYKVGSELDHQKAVFRLDGEAIHFYGIDFPKLMNDRAIHIRKTVADSLNIFVYKDKRVPLDSSQHLPGINELLRVNEPTFYLDTVLMNNGYLLYEQTSPGNLQKSRIDITDLQVRATPFTNDSAFRAANKHVELNTSMKLEDQGTLKGYFNYATGSPKGAYSFAGSLDTFNLQALNPVLTPIAFVRIRDGQVQHAEFFVEANTNKARGKIRVRYSDLKIAFLDKSSSGEGSARKGLTSFVANTVLRSNNPKRKWFPPKAGKIYYRREHFLPVFNFWVSSLLSGVKSTFGFESKELKKEYEKQKETLSKEQLEDLSKRLNVGGNE